MVKTLIDTLAKNSGQHLKRQGEVEAKKLHDALADMIGEIEANNFLGDSG